MANHRITSADLNAARELFEANEPRDLFYRAATELVDLSLRGATHSLTLAEALAVLLQTWNKAHYQYKKFDIAHFACIDRLLLKHQIALTSYRDRVIDDLDHRERTAITKLFQAFETILGPVGGAKALHLLAPKLFPLWDRAIATAYGLTLGAAGTNGERYWQFILESQHQCSDLKGKDLESETILKRIDEYNYCKFTKGWLP